MKKCNKFILCIIMFVCAIASLVGVKKIEPLAETSAHIVTFNYNTSRIIDYIPNQNTTLMDKLKNYSITVDSGDYAVETTKPGSLITPYYTYNWTYNGNVVDLSNFKITHDIEFVAEWTPRMYTVTFKFESDEVKNNISNLQTSMNFTIETPRTNFYKPKLNNYYFRGWFDNSSFEHLYLPARSVGDKVLTAKFSPIDYYINYNTDATHNNPGSYNVKDSNIQLVVPEKEGHIFNGWYSDSGFENKVTEINTSLGGNVNLYPLWQLETYKVTYILPNGLSKVVDCEYGKKADLPKLNKSIFEIVKTDVSRKNITADTTIHIEYVNIWWVYLLGLLLVAGIIVLIVVVAKKRKNTHNKLRMIYHSNSKSRKY